MKLPKPEPGLVFRYDYLWSREAKHGQTTSKYRPACVAVATDAETTPRLVMILPMTHSRPTGATAGVEVPAGVRRLLGLDDEPCWVIVTEHNIDHWPSPGITPLPGRRETFAYGILPSGLFNRIQTEFFRRYDRNRAVRR